MTDPFDALYAPVEPVDPDPRFTTRLRSRLARALALPEGVDMPRTVLDPEPVFAAQTTGYPGVIPYLAVADARRALVWYVDALGARPRAEPIVMPDGRIGHAELELAGGVIMLADEHPEIEFTAPAPGAGTAVLLHIEVSDVDATANRAVEAGARLERPPADESYGRSATLVDPFGHRWTISDMAASSAQEASPGHGDVSYASLWLPDAAAAAAFYAAVLGWRFAPGGGPEGRQVEGVSPPLGLWGGQQHRTTFLCFAVDDVAAAVERVRVAGGEAGEPRQEHGGLLADCVDDQGMAFSLSEAAGQGRTTSGPAPAHGDLAYLTLGVGDTVRAQAFLSAVLGWRFTPGRMEDGWNVDGVAPMAGMHGGAERPVIVPMFAVDDIESAVARVRVAGGTATDPEQMPYGITADCTDDQGFSFYLGQLG